jgi:hypothetical protein
MSLDDTSVFTLRLVGSQPELVKPTVFPMERLAEYLRLYAALIGKKNHPVFLNLQNTSVGLTARVPLQYKYDTEMRLSGSDSSASNVFNEISRAMAKDAINFAEIKNSAAHVLRRIEPETSEKTIVISQATDIDGQIVDVNSKKEGSSVTVLESTGRKMTFAIHNIELGKQLAQKWRGETLRLHTNGNWKRSTTGWWPDPNNCVATSFEGLDNSSALDVFNSFRDIPNNGWTTIENPIQLWEQLRGINEVTHV